MSEPLRSGSVSYGPRAFSQDAELAMGGDITRGCVELITNADDAYTGVGGSGKIIIEVEHRRSQPWKVVVRDRAKGMTAARSKVKPTRARRFEERGAAFDPFMK